MRLLREVEDVLAVVGRRSPADFRPLPFAWTGQSRVLEQAFSVDDPVPPALVVLLGPLLAPRLERLATRLRRRLGRERRRMALSRVREMDPACVQRNSRRPGRTLVEKGGPKQELYGVVRVPRFDTTENRVLVAASQRLEGEASDLLRQLPVEQRKRPGGRAQALRHLLRASREVLSRPELEGIGRPRPGERPSNAMLGDADYRATWRAWQLLKREDSRFADEWLNLESAWAELLLLATWAALDRRADLEPVAAWGSIRHERAGGRRLSPLEPRRWVQWRGGEPKLVMADIVDGDIVIRAGGHPVTQSGALHVSGWGTGSSGVTLTGGQASRAGAQQLAAALVDALEVGDPLVAAPREIIGDRVGLSMLDHRVWASSGGVVASPGEAAAALMPVPDEQPVLAMGRPATWLDGVAGPRDLHASKAGLGGLVARALRGRADAALVVPDAMPMLARFALRSATGPIWLVPAPVAAALAVGTELDEVAEQPFGVLVVVETAASLDIAVLERARHPDRDGDLVWIRSSSTHDGRGGRQEQAGLQAGDLGAWLRAPQETRGWVIDGDRIRPCSWTQADTDLTSLVGKVLAAWKGPEVRAIILCGPKPGTELGVGPLLPMRYLEAGDLAVGAERFLSLHAAGLPTWLDRLPRLDLVVRRGKLRREVTLVERDTLVAPGEQVDHAPPDDFELPAREAQVDFRMALESRTEPYVLRLAGHPLPLDRPIRVRVRIRYLYGREGMTVSVLPTEGASFERLDFTLAAAQSDGDSHGGGLANREFRHDERPPPHAEDVEALRRAFRRLERAWSGLSPKVQKEATKKAGNLDDVFHDALVELRDRTQAIQASGPRTMDAALRRELVEGPAAWLGWLLGHGRVKKAGRPPSLTTKERLEAVRARAWLRVRGTDGVAHALATGKLGVSPDERLPLLGLLVDGQPDEVWQALLSARPEDPSGSGPWALGLCHALDGHPALGASLEGPVVEHLLAEVVEATRGVADLEERQLLRYGRALFRLMLVPPRLCRLREHGHLAADSPAVLAAVRVLEEVRAGLPDEVRQYGGRRAVTHRDEPIAVAIDHLLGMIAAIPSTEDA